jgi:ZIP family zinc transporter
MQQIILFSVLTFCSTLVGGLLAIKFKSRLHQIMAFAAGILLGVVSFDIFPEIIGQINVYGFKTTDIMVALVVGFLFFHVLEKTILIHHAHEEDYAEHKHPQVGIISALALIGHSFMDGASIGLGFQINASVGALVALAIISHAFTDGISTAVLMLANNNSSRKSKNFLLLVAAAPIVGAISTLFFKVSPYFLTLYLGFFAGSLLYIGGSDILPEAHSRRSSFELIGLTILGVALIFIIARLI